MPTAHTTAAARTALTTLQALREVTGKTAEVRVLNAAIDAAIAESERLLDNGDDVYATDSSSLHLEHRPADPPRFPFADRKPAILAELRERATAGKTITYAELGEIVGMPAMGPWKPALDAIGADERKDGRPDIAVLVVSKETGLPGWATTAEDRARAVVERNRVFEHHLRRGTDMRNG